MTFIVDGTSGLTFPNSTTQISSSKVLQVVNASTSTTASTTSSTFTATGLTASITPLFSTSKILVIVSQQGMITFANSATCQVGLYRGSTSINLFCILGAYVNGTVNFVGGSASTNYLDSPATTSSVTYSTKFASGNGSTNVSVQNNSDISTITLMEIAA